MALELRQGARVLVVEDDRDTATVLCSVLGAAGFDARARPGQNDLAQILLSEHVAVLVVSLSGAGIGAVTSLVSELRRRPEYPLSRAGIVVLVDEEFDLFFGLGADADAALVRPVRAERLVEAVTDVAATNATVRLARLQLSR